MISFFATGISVDPENAEAESTWGYPALLTDLNDIPGIFTVGNACTAVILMRGTTSSGVEV